MSRKRVKDANDRFDKFTKAQSGEPKGIKSSGPAKDSVPASGEGEGNIETKTLLGLNKYEEFDAKQGIASAAQGSDLGDYFQYLIEHPVTLARQKSAMLPIVNQAIEGTKVSIYNERTLAKHPLLGLKLKNTSGLHLMQGPITVFEGGTYAGDSRILDMQPKEERLISYAIDLGTEVEVVRKDTSDKITRIYIDKGILFKTTKFVETRVYNVKNRSEQVRVNLIEHPFRPEFKLTTPKEAAERSRDVYRFEFKTEPGKSFSQEVTEERLLESTVHLTNLTSESMEFFLQSSVSSDALKSALQKGLELKSKASDTHRDVNHAQSQLKIILDDQSRLRANIDKVPPTSNAHKRYLEKFDAQETEIEKLNEQIRKMQEREHEQRKAYESYLSTLSVE